MMVEPDRQTEAEGLLERIAETALDDDYYVVRAGPYEHSREFNTVLTGVVLAMFALLVSVAAFQTRSDRPATERERAALISDVDSRKSQLAARETTAAILRKEVDSLTSTAVRFDPAYEDLRVLAADRAATGPGVTVTVSPGPRVGGSISDRDLQVLVNALWYAGAEAISINGNRLGSLSSIRTAGGIIKVNYRPVGPPYAVVALGNSDSLAERFTETPAGRGWEARAKDAGVLFDVTPSSNLTVDAAAPDRLTFRSAKAIKEDG